MNFYKGPSRNQMRWGSGIMVITKEMQSVRRVQIPAECILNSLCTNHEKGINSSFLHITISQTVG